VSTEVLVARIAGRWLCPSCQATFPSHTSTPPGDGRCSVCGDLLYQRSDDRPEVVRHRIEVYLRETLPVVDHYDRRGALARIDGNRSIEAVRTTLCTSLGGVVRGRRRHRWHLYIDHEFRANRGQVDWDGRTLCGKLVDGRSDHELGDEADFLEHPCRRCRLALRARQGPIAPAAEAPSLQQTSA
jgi:hypothetical protein